MKVRHQALIATVLAIVAIAFLLFVPKSHSFDNGYIGGSIGGILPPVNHLGDKVTDIAAAGTGGLVIKEQWKTSRSPSPYYSIKAGWGKTFDKYYSGTEFSINKSRYRMNISKHNQNDFLDSSDELTVRMRDVDVSCDFRQGYLISKDMMVSAKAGLGRSRLRTSLASNNNVKFLGNDYSFPEHYKIEKTVYPVRLGFEFEKKLLKNLSVTADYTYTRIFRRFTLGGKATTTTPGGRVQSNHLHKITVQEAKMSLGLKYYL